MAKEAATCHQGQIRTCRRQVMPNGALVLIQDGLHIHDDDLDDAFDSSWTSVPQSRKSKES